MNENSEDCLLAERFANSLQIRAIVYIQLIFAFLIYFMSFAICRQLYICPPALHSNFKVLIVSLIGFSLVFAITCTVTTTFTQYQYFVVDDPCKFLIKSWIPAVIRAPVYLYIYGISFLHIFLWMERLLATQFCQIYETAGRSCGVFATGCLWTLSLGCFIYAFFSENFTSYRTFISATSPHNANRVFYLSSVCSVIDLMAICLDYILFLKNKKMQENSNLLKWENYRLRRGYQLRENQKTLQLMMYLSIVHSCIYLTYSGLNLTVRVLFSDHDPVKFITLLEACLTIICLHSVIMLGMLHYYLKYSSQKRKFVVEDNYSANDIYFVQFKQQLENIGPARRSFARS